MAEGEMEDLPAADERSVSEVVLDALSEYLGGSGMVTSFYLIADFIDDEGDESYLQAVAEGQKQPCTLGLIAWAQKIADYDAAEFLRASLADDD